MTSKERIKKSLNFKKPDRVGVYDVFLDETLEQWKSQGLPSGQKAQEYFEHDFEIISPEHVGLNKPNETKFVSIAICEPFGQCCRNFGLEETLKNMAYETRATTKVFNKIAADTLKKASSIDGYDAFDGVWLCGDLAYDKGLFFSRDLYKKMLLPLHKELCEFFKSKNLDIIFHSHGDVREILPLLIELGIKAIEPLETESGLDIFELRREYKKDLALFGNIEFDKLKSSRDAFRKEVEEKIGVLKKDGGYIYRTDKDITPDITFDDYKFAMDLVKECGDYRCL